MDINIKIRKILIVDDEIELLNLLKLVLIKEGFENIYTAQNGKDAIQLFEDVKPDLAILDVMLPDMEGYDICKLIRKTSNIPILFLSAKGEELDRVMGLAIGADDYITKPFSLSIMKERVQAVLRRYEGNKKTYIYKINNLEIDFDKFILNKNGERVDITPTEFKLLKVFVNSKGKVLTRNNLLEELWDKDQNFIDEHALTVNINRLRSKIESKDDGVKYIKTIYGIGYMWIGEDA